MKEFIEECKAVLAECRLSEVEVKVNNVMFSQNYDFNFNDKDETLYIRFRIGDISGIIASIGYDEIKSFE